MIDQGHDPLADIEAKRHASPGAPRLNIGRRIADKWREFIERGIEPTCFLYRHYDAAGDLLYVGMTLYVCSRQKDHLQKAEWANSIYQIVIEPFVSREELIKAEAYAIKTEYPKFNKMHNDRTPRRELVAPKPEYPRQRSKPSNRMYGSK